MTISVLLADDHTIMREGLKSLLGMAGDINVIAEASDGRETVQKTREHKPDVVVMDLTMPEMSGIEATEQIIAENPAARILALSMINDKTCVFECLKAGVKGYLVKNCATEELVTAIRALASGKSYLCSKITDLVLDDIAGSSSNKSSSSPSSVLSKREQEVLQLLSAGKSTKEIAFELTISLKTVGVHRNNIMKKLDLHNIAELTKYAVREGLTPIKL